MDTKATAKIDLLRNQSWPLGYSSILLDDGIRPIASRLLDNDHWIIGDSRRLLYHPWIILNNGTKK